MFVRSMVDPLPGVLGVQHIFHMESVIVPVPKKQARGGVCEVDNFRDVSLSSTVYVRSCAY